MQIQIEGDYNEDDILFCLGTIISKKNMVPVLTLIKKRCLLPSQEAH